VGKGFSNRSLPSSRQGHGSPAPAAAKYLLEAEYCTIFHLLPKPAAAEPTLPHLPQLARWGAPGVLQGLLVLWTIMSQGKIQRLVTLQESKARNRRIGLLGSWCAAAASTGRPRSTAGTGPALRGSSRCLAKSRVLGAATKAESSPFPLAEWFGFHSCAQKYVMGKRGDFSAGKYQAASRKGCDVL